MKVKDLIEKLSTIEDQDTKISLSVREPYDNDAEDIDDELKYVYYIKNRKPFSPIVSLRGEPRFGGLEPL